MTDDLVKRLRVRAEFTGPYSALWDDAADRIENLEEEVDILISASIRLASRIDIDSDAYDDRIEELEAALREIIQEDALNGKTVFVGDFGKIACKALEGKDD